MLYKINNYIREKIIKRDKMFWIENSKKIYKELEISFKEYCNIYIYKPNMLLSTNEIMPKIDIYAEKDCFFSKLNIKEKVSFINQNIELVYLNNNNCIYFIYKEEKEQPIILTLWLINSNEIRIGLFIKNTINNIVQDDLLKTLNILETKQYNISYTKNKRGDYVLFEKTIIFKDNIFSFSNKSYILRFVPLIFLLTIKKYLSIKKIK